MSLKNTKESSICVVLCDVANKGVLWKTFADDECI